MCQLVHTEQQACSSTSGLGQARPNATIKFSAGGHPELLELVKAHGYDLAVRRGALPSKEDVAAELHDDVYEPGVAALRREALPEIYAYTDTDLSCGCYQCRARCASPCGDRLRRGREGGSWPARRPRLPSRVPT